MSFLIIRCPKCSRIRMAERRTDWEKYVFTCFYCNSSTKAFNGRKNRGGGLRLEVLLEADNPSKFPKIIAEITKQIAETEETSKVFKGETN